MDGFAHAASLGVVKEYCYLNVLLAREGENRLIFKGSAFLVRDGNPFRSSYRCWFVFV